MKTGVFLSYIGLGSNLLHLTYCHEIAKKHGPITLLTTCQNAKQALEDDPLIDEIIYVDEYYKKFFDIFKLGKNWSKYQFDNFFILYPSIRYYFAAKIAGFKNIKTYSFFKKKNLHLVKTAQKFIIKNLDLKSCPTETKFFIKEEKKNNAKKYIKKDKKNIILGVGSSGPSAKWGAKNYTNLINKLNENDNFFFYLLCGPNETNISSEIISDSKKKNIFSLSNMKINEVIPLIALCDLYVGNDSFGHHVTSQCGLPSIVLMLDSPKAYSDYSINHYRILPEGIELNSISHGSMFSPEQITVNQVYNKVISLIS
ncbi:lipopolysaccharide heptosyltransferase family protein [Candidatus Pelagibacter sp.]|nr:lipopolysaccharide heptosyltransferase family protein [Candidatus Pelagibacter sp.]